MTDYESWLQTIPESTKGTEASREFVAKAVPSRAFDFARSGFDCRLVSYASDGHTIFGYVVQPKQDTANGKRPVLVYNRGGNSSFGRIDSLQLFREFLPLAKAGYLVVASQYRGSVDGNAKKFGADEFGGKDVGDVLRMIDLSLTLPSADANNLFMLGASRCGMMSYLVARQRTDIRAMATIAGATDLRAGLEWRPEKWNASIVP
ncbi:MAG: alpha/beta hydrolase family protein [Lysobacter sp.]